MKNFLTTVLLSVLCAGMAGAHSAHTQVTEVEWNSTSGFFEVAMRLDATALEDSVSIQTGHRFRLESAEQVDAVLAEFIPMHFRIDAGQSTERGTVQWAGHELQLHTVWLYFVYLPGCVSNAKSTEARTDVRPARSVNLNEVRIENKCLMDVRPDTIHFVQLRCGKSVGQAHCSYQQPRTGFSKLQSPTTTKRKPDNVVAPSGFVESLPDLFTEIDKPTL